MIETALIAQAAVFGLIVVVFLMSGTASMFHPLTFYLIFHGLVFVARPILVHIYQFGEVWFFMGFWPSPQQFVLTLLVSTVALTAFALACGLTGNVRPDLDRQPTQGLDTAEVVAYGVTLLLLGPLAIYSAIMRQEGASFDFTGDVQMERDPVTGQPIYVNTTGYIAEAHAMGLPLTLGLIFLSRFNPLSFIPFGMFVLYRAYLGWGRWAIIMGVISLVLLVLYHTRHKWFAWWHVLAGLPVLFLFHLLGTQRGYIRALIQGEAPPVTEEPGRSFVDSLANQDLANFDFLTYILWVVPGQSNTYTYFTQYLQLFTEPIPRMFWPGKPVGAPIKLVELNDYGNFSNLTASLAGDGWMSGGWLGMIITMVLVGAVLGRVHRWFWEKGSLTRPGVLFYCTFVPLSLQWYRDGGISIFKFGLFALLPILVWVGMTRLLRAWIAIGVDEPHPGPIMGPDGRPGTPRSAP